MTPLAPSSPFSSLHFMLQWSIAFIMFFAGFAVWALCCAGPCAIFIPSRVPVVFVINFIVCFISFALSKRDRWIIGAAFSLPSLIASIFVIYIKESFFTFVTFAAVPLTGLFAMWCAKLFIEWFR